MNSRLIKVCGMREADNIRQVEALGIDWLGFIFWPKSSRFVHERPAYLPASAKRVGVFVDADIEVVRETAAAYCLDIIQLHGKESPSYIKQLRSLFSDHVAVIVKAFNIATPEDLKQTEPYEGATDYFLFDTKAKMVGGNGTQFDWTVLNDYQGNTPFILSGGIGPDDAEKVKAFHHPMLAGIDLNSRFETVPAHKDVNLLRTFIETIKNENNE